MVLDAERARRKEMARKQRKSKFAIDISKAGTDDVTMALVGDLLRKYPRGIDGRLGNKKDYNDCYSCNPGNSRAGQYCGYTFEQLWTLVKHLINDDGGIRYGRIEALVNKHWEWCGDSKNSYRSWMPEATSTRRCNRLRSRLTRITRYWEDYGRKAIYKWSPGYGSGHLRDTPFYVWGNDKTDARAQVETLWIPILNATGLAGTDHRGNERSLDLDGGTIQMHTETDDSSMTTTSAFDTMQVLMNKRQKILDDIAAAQQTAEQLSSLIEFVSQAAEG